MRRDELLNILTIHQPDQQARGVKSLALFGSVARDQAREESDIDLLVEFTEPPRYRHFIDLKFFLEDLLHCRIDLVTPRGLKPRLKSQIEKELIHVAGF